jgi:hypothetical protein
MMTDHRPKPSAGSSGWRSLHSFDRYRSPHQSISRAPLPASPHTHLCTLSARSQNTRARSATQIELATCFQHRRLHTPPYGPQIAAAWVWVVWWGVLPVLGDVTIRTLRNLVIDNIFFLVDNIFSCRQICSCRQVT